VIRPFGIRDVVKIQRLQPQGVAFDLKKLLLDASSPMQSALVGYLTYHHLGTITCIHDGAGEGKDLRGFVQVYPHPEKSEWSLAFLSPSLESHLKASDIWYRLLTYLVIYGAEQGISRIAARAPEDGEIEDVLRQAGFTVVNREEVFTFSGEMPSGPMPKGLFRLESVNSWAVGEFFRQVVPQCVQVGTFPTCWQTTGIGAPSGADASDEFVWLQEDKVLAYFGLQHTSKGCWLDIVVRPEHRGDILHCIKYILTLFNCTDKPVYCAVPDYSVGLGWLLRTLGFSTYARQVLLVAYTAARVPIRRQVAVTGLDRTVDLGTPVYHADLLTHLGTITEQARRAG